MAEDPLSHQRLLKAVDGIEQSSWKVASARFNLRKTTPDYRKLQ
jgi:hypothetical protein